MYEYMTAYNQNVTLGVWIHDCLPLHWLKRPYQGKELYLPVLVKIVVAAVVIIVATRVEMSKNK